MAFLCRLHKFWCQFEDLWSLIETKFDVSRPFSTIFRVFRESSPLFHRASRCFFPSSATTVEGGEKGTIEKWWPYNFGIGVGRTFVRMERITGVRTHHPYTVYVHKKWRTYAVFWLFKTFVRVSFRQSDRIIVLSSCTFVPPCQHRQVSDRLRDRR